MRLLLFLVSIISFIIFVYFSYLVSKETFTQFDFDTTVKVQDRISNGVDLPFSTLSILGSAEIIGLIVLFLTALFLFKRYWITMIVVPLFFIVGTFIEVFGKLFLYHPGPPLLLYRGVLNIDFPSHFIPSNYAYPSGHSFRTTYIIAFLIVVLQLKLPASKRLPFQLLLIALLGAMTISRVYLGEHWTTDVIGGFLMGISFGIISGLTLVFKKDRTQPILKLGVDK